MNTRTCIAWALAFLAIVQLFGMNRIVTAQSPKLFVEQGDSSFFFLEPTPQEDVNFVPDPPSVETADNVSSESVIPSGVPPSLILASVRPLTVDGVPDGLAILPQSPSASKTYPTIDVTGFAQIDAVFFAQDENSYAVNGDIQDFASFRRTRLATKGQLTENTGYFLEMDFAFPGRPSFMDVWVEQQKVPVFGNIRIGQFRQPLSLDAMTSVRDLMFLERASPFAFVPFRQIGVMAYDTAFDETFTWAASVYRFPTDPWGNSIGDGGYGTSYRFTTIPIYDADCNEVLHLGFGYSLNNPGDNGSVLANNQLRYQAVPEVGITNGQHNNIQSISDDGLTGPFLANTGFILDVKNNSVFNLEFAYAYESFLFQAEYFDVIVNRSNNYSLHFYGAYAQAAWVLTGEHHKYNKKNAVFGRVIPKHQLGSEGWGAWEIAGRWSLTDLRDTENPFVLGKTETIPAALTDLTLGVNWYWNPYAKMQFNYIHSIQDIRTGPRANTDILALRTQFDF